MLMITTPQLATQTNKQTLASRIEKRSEGFFMFVCFLSFFVFFNLFSLKLVLRVFDRRSWSCRQTTFDFW